jgi:hypothetical protein
VIAPDPEEAGGEAEADLAEKLAEGGNGAEPLFPEDLPAEPVDVAAETGAPAEALEEAADDAAEGPAT